MFLHSGASLHGHEYSVKRSPSAPLPPPRSFPILKSALRPLALQSDLSETDRSISSDSPDIRLVRRLSTDEKTYHTPPVALRQRAVSNNFTRKDLAVRFHEPGMDQYHTPSASEDEESVAGSEFTNGTADMPSRHKRNRRLPRKSTKYALAQPAPQLLTKQRRLVQIRPRLLLQLQEIGDRRAIPAFDIVPSQVVAGALIIPKLSKRFPRMFHANAELSQNDVLLVRSEDYGSTSSGISSMVSEDDSGGSLHDREVWAVISALAGDCEHSAEIVLEDGLPWYASPMANGSYEFTSINDEGETTTARWVRRSNVSTRNSIASLEPSSTRSSLQGALSESRWTFSIIDPSSRRHPIMGSLTSESIEVYDHYTTLSTSSGRFPPTRAFGSEMSSDDRSQSPAGFKSESRTTLEVLPEQKALMIATASWVRLHQQGWPASANPKFARSTSSHHRPASASRCSTARRQTYPSYDEDSSRATSPINPSRSPDSLPASSLSKLQNRPAMPARAMSTGRAFMKRRSDRLEGLTTVYSQEPHESVLETEKLGRQQEEKAGCMSKMRQWTHKVFHRKRDTSD